MTMLGSVFVYISHVVLAVNVYSYGM